MPVPLFSAKRSVLFPGVLFLIALFPGLVPVWPGAAKAEEADTMSVEELFDKNDAALAKTRRIEMRYKIKELHIPERENLWIESGEEKFLQPIEPSNNGEGTTSRPTYFTHGGALFSTYLDAEHRVSFAPKSLTESLNSGHGYKRCPDSFNWELESPRRQIFFSPVFGLQGTPPTLKESTLREAFFNSPWQSEPKKSTNDRGEVLWTVFSAAEPLTEEEMSLDNPDKGWTMIQFNQTKGFWVECSATFAPAPAGIVQNSGEPIPLVFSGCVTEYKDIAPDLVVPRKIVHLTTTPEGFRKGQARLESPAALALIDIYEAKIDDRSIRVPEIKIPQYARVFRDDLLDPNREETEVFAPVSFWGKDDAPEVTFLSSEEKEFDEYVRQRYNMEQTPLPESGFSSTPLWRVTLLGVGLLLVVAALVLKRRLPAARE